MRHALVLRFVVVALAAALAAPARAQILGGEAPTTGATGGASLVLGLGPSFPIGDLRDGVDNGLAGLAGVAVGVPGIPVGLRLEGMYQRFGVQRGSGDVSTLSGGVNALLRTPATLPLLVHPFITGGVGYARTRVGTTDFFDASGGTANGVTWNLGGGVALPIPFFAIGLEARYVEVRERGNSLGSVPVFLTLTLRR